MQGITLSADEITTAPPGVRRWLEQEIACTVGQLTTPEPAVCAPTLLSSECDQERPDEAAGGCMLAVTSQGTIKMDAMQDEAIRKLVAARAYELWENEGQPHDRDLVNWRQAEQEIMSCVGNGANPAPPKEVTQARAGSRVRRGATT